MAKKDIDSLLFSMFESLVLENGFELVDTELVKEGQDWFVRVYIDKEGGIKVNDCETVSRQVEALMDERDPVSQSYILEVSSPGLDRALKKPADFLKYVGKTVDIKLYKAVEKQKEFEGELLGLVDETISIKDESGNVLNFKKADVASCRLHVFF